MDILTTSYFQDKNKLEVKTLINKLVEYDLQFIDRIAEFLSIILKDKKLKIKGGIILSIRHEAIYINHLWIDETYRKQGYGSKLLMMAEEEGRKRGCQFSIVDTMEFEAEKFYEKNGYESIGRIENYIQKYDRVFFRKSL